ncbi:MAG: cobalt-precorrin-5B (C(1))-methyltransferase CbiD, partial [Oscillospiraceae bacterium]|nr:cobalt-precorrin-5B (C(1))-methyltransferase CbiD [Oscillospiraceae bacterium]
MHSGNLRNGYTTGTCATAASLASVIWQTTGKIPDSVEVLLQSGGKLRLEIQNVQEIPEMHDSKKYGKFPCGVIKDAGDDVDVTNHCLVISSVRILAHDGDVKFSAGEGIGIVTRKGLKIPVGEPAINPVPRAMITKAIRSVIGTKAAYVKISVPGGEKMAQRTFNPRLGIQNGLSILGTTGIVRPMSQDAVKESLRLELSMC